MIQNVANNRSGNEQQLHQKETPAIEQSMEVVTNEKVAVETLFVNEFTNGLLNPEDEMLGPIRNGGTIIANIPPGNWGPMMTPEIRGGHEVTKPIYIQGAEVGDAIIVKIQSIQVTSIATSSGTAKAIPERFIGNPLLNVKCPGCGKLIPNTYVNGIGKSAVCCEVCHTETSPFEMTNGYTMVLDSKYDIGVTVSKEGARKIAINAQEFMHLPENSIQNTAVSLAPTDISGLVARMRPFIGQIGTLPAVSIPETYNAKDLGSILVDTTNEFSISKGQEPFTDGNLTINKLREGAILICPVKVKGGGIYLGGLVAMQGEGNAASSGTDVSGIVQVQVSVLKKANLLGPVLIPNAEDLTYTLKPFSKDEREAAKDLAEEYGIKQIEETLPLSFIGSGKNLNAAIENGFHRASSFLELSIDEIKNRTTIAGSIEIGRLPGIVIISLQVPKSILKKKKLYKLVKQQYRK